MTTGGAIFIGILLAISLVSGIFGVTQMQYENRLSPLRSFYHSIITFVLNFFLWLVTIPYAIIKDRIRVKTIHKISATEVVDKK